MVFHIFPATYNSTAQSQPVEQPEKKMKKLSFIVMTVLVLAAFAPWAEAGTVSGTISVSGINLKTEGAKSDKEVIVYLEKAGDATYPDPPSEHALVDQKNLVFLPHVLPVQKGTTVDFVNSDTTAHNVFCVDECCKIVEDINSKKAKFLDLGNFPGGAKASHTFNIPGEGVILCKLHPEMAAYIVVLETPYFASAAVGGSPQTASYSIENVPAGDYLLKTWNKKGQSTAQELTVGDGDTKADVELQRKQRKKRKKKSRKK